MFENKNIYTLLDIKIINQVVFKVRFYFFIFLKGLKKSKFINTNSFDIDRSESKLMYGKTNHIRPKWTREPLLGISNKASLKVLSIGTRYETEILYLLSAGFRDIRGLDTFSYSPYIDIGDMHEMPYQDNTFDVIIAGWIIPYSRQPEIVRDEIIRVSKNGSIISLGVSSYTEERYLYIISGKKNEDSPHSNINVESISFKEYLQTVEQFRVLFGKNVNIELFTKNPYITTAHYDSNKDHCIYCFEVKK